MIGDAVAILVFGAIVLLFGGVVFLLFARHEYPKKKGKRP